MFFNCIILFGCFDFAGLFPLQSCNIKKKRFLAFLDCGGDVEEQRNFMETFSDHSNRKTSIGNVDLKFILPAGNICSQGQGLMRLNFNGDLSMSSMLTLSKQWKESEGYPCRHLSVSFIFMFDITDINNSSNPIIKEILDNVNENRDYNIFFIIQSSENSTQAYSAKDFIHFTPSFKDLKSQDIFNKICDMNIENNSIPSIGRDLHTSKFRIVNQLSEISGVELFCFCKKSFGMNAYIPDTDDDYFLDMIKYMKNKSIVKGTRLVNVPLVRTYDVEGAGWISGNPFTFPDSSRNEHACYYNIYRSNLIGNMLPHAYKHMEYIDCNKTLENSLVICEVDNAIPRIYHEELNLQMSTNNVAITQNQAKKILTIVYGKDYFRDCPLNNQITSTSKEYACVTYISNENNITRHHFITLLNKSTSSVYYLKIVNISKCEMYNECQNIMSYNEIDYTTSNATVDIFCVDDKNSKTFNHNTCSIRTVNVNLTLEYVQCESNKNQQALKCILNYDNQCEDNSNLYNCKDFVCPEPFVKCINSYCIFPHMVRNENPDCPHGEDEFVELNHKEDSGTCNAYLMFNIRDICLDLNSFQDLIPIIGNDTQYVCDNVCPKNYKCLSAKIEEHFSNKGINKVKHLKFGIRTFIFVYDIIMVRKEYESLINSHLLAIISFMGRWCHLTNFDYQLQYWKLYDLITLDVSFNSINHSNYLKSVEQFSQLKLLNLSHNENLIIDQSFYFPRSLEIIDLSYTKIKALGNHAFVQLRNLKHLNLSHTLVAQVKDMGLPDYFTLDTLYIQQIQIQHIDKNLFRGLTINSELMASDFALCCPRILNPNISVDKCHALVDFISSCPLVGDMLKKILIWIVGLLTIAGNGFVLVYGIGWNREILKKANGFFITGLAISDLFMGVYLMIIAIVDVYYDDKYGLNVFQWRNSSLCNLCGFISTLSTVNSKLFICLITVDRFLCVTYPSVEHTYSKTGKILSNTLVWFIGCALALTPVFLSDWQIYSSNGLCLALPLSPTQNRVWIFSFVVFVGLNFVIFMAMAVGQLSILINLKKANTSVSNDAQLNQTRSDNSSAAKKVAYVAFTDFCCWLPVVILAFLSFNGYVLKSEVYAWIAGFVFPINSALNPIIFTIPAVYSKYETLAN